MNALFAVPALRLPAAKLLPAITCFPLVKSFRVVLSLLAVASLSVAPVIAQDIPVATGGTFSTDEDTAGTGQLVAVGAAGHKLTYSIEPGTVGTLKGTLTIDPDSGAFAYMPERDYHGDDEFSYIASDGALSSAPARVRLVVNPVNDAPVATGGRFEIKEDESLTQKLVATDADYDTISIRTGKEPENGKVTIAASGIDPNGTEFTYTPNPNFNGEDSFTFIARDAESDSNEAKVVVNVAPINDPPVANPLVCSVPPNRTLIDQLAGFDVDLDRITYQMESGPSTGNVTVDEDGRFTYIPPQTDFKGSVTFTYSVSDGEKTSAPATVEIKVGCDAVGFIADTLLPKVTSADFPTGAGSFESLQFDLTATGLPTILDQCVDRANRRLYVLTPSGIEIFEIQQRVGPPTLNRNGTVPVTGSRLAISIDGRTAYVGGTGKVTAVNLYPEGVYSSQDKGGQQGGDATVQPAYRNMRVYPFSPARPVAAMGVHPRGDRLIVVIDALVKKLNITNDLLLSDSGNGILGRVPDADVPADFGFLTALDISADARTDGPMPPTPTCLPPASLKELIYRDGKYVALGIKDLAFSPDGNCLFLSAVGGQTPRATPFGIMPTSDDSTGGIVVLDVRPRPANKPWVQFLTYIPTIVQNREHPELSEETAKMRHEIWAAGSRIVHPHVQYAREQRDAYAIALELSLATANRFTTGPSFMGFLAFSFAASELESSFKDYGNMQAYFFLYPRDMVGASSVAISHGGDFGVVTLEDTNNLGLLSVRSADTPEGYSVLNRPDFYIKQGTGKTINGFGDAATGYSSNSPFSWAYPQKVVFTSDDSRIYIGMAGGTPKSANSNKFGSGDAYKLYSERDLLKGFFTGSNPPPGYSLFGGDGNAPHRSPRMAAALQSFDSDHDLLSDHLEAYNRWNSLNGITWAKWTNYLVSTNPGNLTDPGKPAPMDNGIKDIFDRGYFVPPSGAGYRLNRYGMPADTTNFATKGVVTALEQIGLEWDRRFHENENKVIGQYPVSRPYFIIGLLSQPGGGKIVNFLKSVDGLVKTEEALRYKEGTGSEVDFPYFSIGSDMPHDFVKSNGASRPCDNSVESDEGFDRANTEALIRLLLEQPRVTTIELDPFVVDLIPGIKDDPRIVVHGRRSAPGSKEIPTERRDLDDHMFVTFSSMYVDMDIDSDNDGVINGTYAEDQLEDQSGALGKYVPANIGDVDNDLTPNYADGYDLFPEHNTAGSGGTFTPISITFPEGLDLAKTRFRLVYSESDPAAVTRSDGPPIQYTLPHTGAYRIWTKDGVSARKKAQISAGGDFIKSNETYRVADLGSHLTGRKVGLFIESVEPGIKASEREVLVEVVPDAGPQSSVQAITDTVLIYSFTSEMAVDLDGDGKIQLAGDNGVDRTSAKNPYRFWLNNDIDRSHTTNNDMFEQTIEQDDLDNSPDGKLDWEETVIPCERDLEDFARLWIATSGLDAALASGEMKLGLKWENVTSGAPSIKVFRAADPDGGLGYLLIPDVATQQVSPNADHTGYGYAIAFTPDSGGAASTIVTGTPGYIFPRSVFEDLAKAQGKTFLLFEACNPGVGELQLVIYDRNGTRISETPGVHLELKPIRSFYQTWTVGDNLSGGVHYAQGSPRMPIPPSTSYISAAGSPSLPPPITEAEKDFVLFVHGWNMSLSDKDRYAETVLKRLWWQGYRGRFGLFRWPTFYIDGSDLDGIGPALDWLNFDASEFNSWCSGRGLLELLNELKNTYHDSDGNSRVRVLAHSHGNIAVGEALRSASSPIVHTYVASQAAIAAHCYDNDLTRVPDISPNWAKAHWYLQLLKNSDRLQFVIDEPVTAVTPNVYAYYPGAAGLDIAQQFPMKGSPYLSGSIGAMTYVNYYNESDWALDGWITDQALKPDNGFDYGFFMDATLSHPYLFFWSFAEDAKDPWWLTIPDDTFKIFSFAAQARSKPLGRQPGVMGVFNGREVSWNEYGDKHPGHSAQFRSAISERWKYWRELLFDFKLKSRTTPSP